MTEGSYSHDLHHFRWEHGKLGDCQVGCEQVAFLGHEMSRFAAFYTPPKPLKLLNLLCRAANYEYVGRVFESPWAHQ